MATDWGPIVQTGIGAVAAIGGGFVGSWIQVRYQHRSDRDRRRERAAEILAEARALLTEANPDRLAFNACTTTSPRTFDDLQGRWREIRVPLLTLSTVGDSKPVRDLARQLEPAMANALTRAAFLVGDLLRNRDIGDAREDANRDHTEAIGLLGQLEEAIQRA